MSGSSVAQRGLAGALLGPVDMLRSTVLRALAPIVSPLFGDRARRVRWLGVFSVVSALLVTAVVPLWSLALGPVILGVPHLLSDVRYLVVRPGLHKQWGTLLLMAAPLVAISFGVTPAIGLLAVLPATLFGPKLRWGRLGLVLLGWLGLSALALQFAFEFMLAFVHLHNVVAVLLWWALVPRRAAMAWVPLSIAAALATIFSGALDPLLTLSGGWSAPWTETSFTEFVTSTTPTDLEPTLAAHLVLSFCFLQSVHYAMWLRLVPDDARDRRAPRTFLASWQALADDFGRPFLLLVLALALGIAGWGLWSLAEARLGYLQLAGFHGYLELAIAARWLVHGRLR